MWEQTGSRLGKEYDKAVMLSSCLFHLYAEDIILNAWLDEAQTGVKTPGETSTPSDMHMVPPYWQKVKRN